VTDNREIRDLLVEIRDNQQRALEQQAAQLAVAREQLERARVQVAESIDLQRQAIARVKRISAIAIPGILACIAAIAYLVFRYF